MAKSWRYLIANKYIKTLMLLLTREMKIAPYLGIPPGSFQYSECVSVARRIRLQEIGRDNDCLQENK